MSALKTFVRSFALPFTQVAKTLKADTTEAWDYWFYTPSAEETFDVQTPKKEPGILSFASIKDFFSWQSIANPEIRNEKNRKVRIASWSFWKFLAYWFGPANGFGTAAAMGLMFTALGAPYVVVFFMVVWAFVQTSRANTYWAKEDMPNMAVRIATRNITDFNAEDIAKLAEKHLARFQNAATERAILLKSTKGRFDKTLHTRLKELQILFDQHLTCLQSQWYWLLPHEDQHTEKFAGHLALTHTFLADHPRLFAMVDNVIEVTNLLIDNPNTTNISDSIRKQKYLIERILSQLELLNDRYALTLTPEQQDKCGRLMAELRGLIANNPKLTTSMPQFLNPAAKNPFPTLSPARKTLLYFLLFSSFATGIMYGAFTYAAFAVDSGVMVIPIFNLTGVGALAFGWFLIAVVIVGTTLVTFQLLHDGIKHNPANSTPATDSDGLFTRLFGRFNFRAFDATKDKLILENWLNQSHHDLAVALTLRDKLAEKDYAGSAYEALYNNAVEKNAAKINSLNARIAGIREAQDENPNTEQLNKIARRAPLVPVATVLVLAGVGTTAYFALFNMVLWIGFTGAAPIAIAAFSAVVIAIYSALKFMSFAHDYIKQQPFANLKESVHQKDLLKIGGEILVTAVVMLGTFETFHGGQECFSNGLMLEAGLSETAAVPLSWSLAAIPSFAANASYGLKTAYRVLFAMSYANTKQQFIRLLQSDTKSEFAAKIVGLTLASLILFPLVLLYQLFKALFVSAPGFNAVGNGALAGEPGIRQYQRTGALSALMLGLISAICAALNSYTSIMNGYLDQQDKDKKDNPTDPVYNCFNEIVANKNFVAPAPAKKGDYTAVLSETNSHHASPSFFSLPLSGDPNDKKTPHPLNSNSAPSTSL